MLTEPIGRAEQIAKLNDRARSGFDPSARIMLLQAAPLMTPYRPNATFAATV